MWKICAILSIFICVCLFCSSFIIIKIKLSLDQASEKKIIKYGTQPVLGFCPSLWTRKQIKDEKYCIQNNSLEIFDKDKNLIAVKSGQDCPGEFVDNYCVID